MHFKKGINLIYLSKKFQEKEIVDLILIFTPSEYLVNV